MQILTISAEWCAKCQDKPRAASHSYCRTCRNEYQNEYRRRRYREEPAYRRKTRQQVRARLYGISEERYTELWAQQGGVCSICLTAPEDKELCVDHNHTTGQIRGLLCDNCNGAIGMLRERPALLARATEYLERQP